MAAAQTVSSYNPLGFLSFHGLQGTLQRLCLYLMTVEESLVGTYLNEALQDELELLKEIFFKEIKLLDR